MFNSKHKTPVAYFGLLERKEEREELEPKVALELLEKQKIKTELVYVVMFPLLTEQLKIGNGTQTITFFISCC